MEFNCESPAGKNLARCSQNSVCRLDRRLQHKGPPHSIMSAVSMGTCPMFQGPLLSFRRAHPLNHRLKAWITAQFNKMRVFSDSDYVAQVRLLGYVQPVQCILFIP